MKTLPFRLLIASFMLLYTFNTLFIESDLSSLIHRSVTALEIKTSMLFNLRFPNSTTCFFLFFLIAGLYFFIIAAFAQIFNPTAELAISIGITNKEAKAEIETNSLTVETKISNCSI